MMELPEAATVSRQLEAELRGKKVRRVQPGKTPHKFAFFNGNPAGYDGALRGALFSGTAYMGPFAQLNFGAQMLLLGDGVGLRFLPPGTPPPEKYQLLVEFSDGSALACLVQMYGGMWLANPGAYDNPYYRAALAKPDALGEGFSPAYFEGLWAAAKKSLSAKAFLATEQRIPGLGNGMLQDILFRAGVHPKTRLQHLPDAKMDELYTQTTSLLRTAARKGGRNTERDIYGAPGGYEVILSAKTAKEPCPVCGSPITKQAYLGGSVYFCPQCQPLLA